MKKPSIISVAFTLIILLLVGQGALSLFYLDTIASQTQKLYKHPYTVSNAARNIDINLVSMHRYMKDVALSETAEKRTKASLLVDQHEQQVLDNFETIFDRYLGDRNDIQTAYNDFINWKSIRDEVISLKALGEDQRAADITRNKGADHVEQLNGEVQKLIDYADNKAKTFLGNAIDAEKKAFAVIISLLLATAAASVLSSIYAVRRLTAAQIDTKSRMYLIDQNILMAKMDHNGIVTDISNHLCRHFGLNKQDTLGQQADFFINDDRAGVLPKDILAITSTGKAWEGDIRRINPDGGVQWIRSVVHPELDGNYAVRGYTNIIQDITTHKAIEELSITDPLTGLYNRRHFDTLVEKETRLAHRNKTHLALSVIDVDFFKKYNDHYGHPAGDAALSRVAQTLKQSLNRPSDHVFRLGGEEFGLLFTHLDKEETSDFLNVIKNKIESLKIEHSNNEVSDYLTISIGSHVLLDGDASDNRPLYTQADAALYKAKVQRNSVVLT
ncbi:MAG: diguanylate cyclase [Algisphaera sp.]